MENLDEIKVNITLCYAYSEDSNEISGVNSKVYENSYVLANDIIDDIITKGFNNIDKSAISLYDEDLKIFVYLGIAPLETSVKISIPKEKQKILQVKFKSRPILKMDYLMKMNLIEEENDNNEENQNFFINKKSKRSKERKINFIIEKVLLWRKLYNGFEDEKGNTIKLTLEEAADKVGISKKSLDDYLIQIRNGKIHGFNFNEHKNDKVGILRSFVKKCKTSNPTEETKKRIFDSSSCHPSNYPSLHHSFAMDPNYVVSQNIGISSIPNTFNSNHHDKNK